MYRAQKKSYSLKKVKNCGVGLDRRLLRSGSQLIRSMHDPTSFSGVTQALESALSGWSKMMAVDDRRGQISLNYNVVSLDRVFLHREGEGGDVCV